MKALLSNRRVRLVIVTSIVVLIARWGYHRLVWPWWYVRGRWYFENRRAEKLVREDPSNPQSWISLGCARYWVGDKAGSLEAYHRAWEFDTNDVNRAYSVAFALRESGREAEAASWFSNIITMCERQRHPEWTENATNNLWTIHTYWLKPTTRALSQ